MKLILFGAAGEIGRHIAAEAVHRGHSVTGVHRSPGQAETLPFGTKSLALDVAHAPDLAGVVAGHDLIVTALRPPDGQEQMLVPLTERILLAAGATGRRVIVSGGAACLNLDDGSGETVLSADGFLPDHVVPIARACQAQYDLCRDYLSTCWTYACPPAMLTDAPRTGAYRRGTDTLVTDRDGLSRIGMADFAVAIMDEAENPGPPRRRFTAGY